jgi:hypothetical protein
MQTRLSGGIWSCWTVASFRFARPRGPTTTLLLSAWLLLMERDLPAPIVSRANRNLGGRVKLTGNAKSEKWSSLSRSRLREVRMLAVLGPDVGHYRQVP